MNTHPCQVTLFLWKLPKLIIMCISKYFAWLQVVKKSVKHYLTACLYFTLRTLTNHAKKLMFSHIFHLEWLVIGKNKQRNVPSHLKSALAKAALHPASLHGTWKQEIITSSCQKKTQTSKIQVNMFVWLSLDGTATTLVNTETLYRFVKAFPDCSTALSKKIIPQITRRRLCSEVRCTYTIISHRDIYKL